MKTRTTTGPEFSSNLPSLPGMQALILSILSDKREMYGLEMVTRSNGALARGTVYVTLSRMEDKGLLESRKEIVRKGLGGPPRRLYKQTEFGKRVFAAHRRFARTLSALVPMTTPG